MSVAVAARASDFKVIFDGQSLNYSPTATNNYRTKLMAGRGIHSASVAISGFAWTQLKNLLTSRVDQYILRGKKVIVIGLGGTTDYALNQSGSQVYASEVTWASGLRSIASAASIPIYIVQTTTTPSTSFGADTTVASGSNGVNTNTFTGTGTLNVASTTNAPSTGTVKVATGGTQATITYTGITATTFTGCNTTSGGGVMSTGGTVRSSDYQSMYDGNVLVMADASNAFDYSIDLAGDSRLANPANTTYYQGDGTHLTDAGAQVVADLITPALDALLAL